MGHYMSYYIWTEIYNCGKIGKIALESFQKFHPDLIVNVYGFEKDFEHIVKSPNIVPVIIPERSFYLRLWRRFFNSRPGFAGKIDRQLIEDGFKNGHLGTANLWAYIIQNRKEKYLIHFDSDTIFLGNILDEMISLTDRYDIVGPIRNYKNNPFNDTSYRKFNDVSATNCFLFNREKIDVFSFNVLVSMCQGAFNPLGHKVIDFFDPISFNILKNMGEIFFLDPDDVGACDANGGRNNKFAAINNFDTPFKIDYGNKLIHFSAVGSGMNIYNSPDLNIPDAYKQYAIDRYALFCKIFYKEDLGIDLSKYTILLKFFEENVTPYFVTDN
jgi:hypothetical protein